MAAGLILKTMDIEYYMTNLSNHFVNIFLILLLPPIIFESGYNMKKKPFFKNLGSLMLYSFLGTFIAIFTTGLLMFALSLTPLTNVRFTLKESFAFGSLISATDTVSILSIFKEMNADIDLYSLVFGESVFNDAITMVFYRALTESKMEDETFGTEILNTII